MTTVGLPPGWHFVRSLGGIDEYVLEANGFKVLTLHDDSAPVVTFMVTYLVGSRNEAVGHTGATHLLEHMMFKGTPRFHRDRGTHIATVLKNVGAFYNATTWYDRTNYFELLPSDQLERAIQLEADRMRNALIADEDRQREMTVVRNEFERLENNPESVLETRLFAHAYLAHPYHHATIGWRADIEGMSTERLRQFYDTFYHPNNAVTVIAGDFDRIAALEWVGKYFGVHPCGPNPIPGVYTVEPPQQGERRFEVHRAGELGLVYIGQKTPQATHPDTYALAVLAKIMSAGKTSRLYRALVDKNLAVSQSTRVYALRDPSLLVTRAALNRNVLHTSVEAAIVHEYERMYADGLEASELETAKQKIRVETAFSRDGTWSLVSVLNEAIASADWTYYTTYLDRIEQVTAADVRRVARTYLGRLTRTVGHFVPDRAEEAGNATASDGSAGQFGPLHLSALVEPGDLPVGHGKTVGRFEQRIRRKQLATGATLLSLSTRATDVVSLRASLVAGDATSPPEHLMLADLTGGMLDRGTQRLDKFGFAAQLEQVGAQLSVAVSTFTLDCTARCLKNDLPRVIELFADLLRQPRFDPDEMEKLKQQRVAQLHRQFDDTATQAMASLHRSAFPVLHPRHSPPLGALIEDVERLTVADLRAFHDKVYGGATLTLVLTGDIDPVACDTAFGTCFEDWPGGCRWNPLSRLEPAGPPQRSVVTLRDKASVDLRFGHVLPLRPADPDYLPFVVANRVLGHSSIASRLGLRIRDTEGLTYGIHSSLTTSCEADGLWYVAMTVAPENVTRAIASVRDEIERFLQDGVTLQEFQDELQAMGGRFQVTLGLNTGSLASQILYVETQGLGLSYLDDYAQRLSALTPDRVNAALRRYLRPDCLHLTMAGSLNEQQQPLPAA